MLNKFFLTALVIAFLPAVSALGVPIDTIDNGGFETGDITGWTNVKPSGATTTVVSSHNEQSSGTGPVTYSPTEGDYFALLKTDGPGSLNQLYQSFTAGTGDILSFDIFFDADDYIPYNDYGKAYVLDSSNNKVGGGDLFYSDIASVGDYGETPWTPVSLTFTKSDTYTLYVEITNGKDSVLDSYVGVDNVQQQSVPVPATLCLMSFGVLGLLGFGLRKRRQ